MWTLLLYHLPKAQYSSGNFSHPIICLPNARMNPKSKAKDISIVAVCPTKSVTRNAKVDDHIAAEKNVDLV